MSSSGSAQLTATYPAGGHVVQSPWYVPTPGGQFAASRTSQPPVARQQPPRPVLTVKVALVLVTEPQALDATQSYPP
jgi:hypothetical protein